MARIVRKRPLTGVTQLFAVEAPLIARNAQAGQFVVVRTHPRGERVPVTITDFDPERGLVTIVVQEVGRTTRLICALGEGDEFQDFVGPLGKPAPLPTGGHVALVGGGFGAGAIYTLARQLGREGALVSSVVGARTADLLILTGEMSAVSDRLHVCTDDGSAGYHGFVTGKLGELLETGDPPTHCFAIGPLAMMRSVAEATRPHAIPTWVSLDPIMIDATGMCGACRVTVGGERRFACVDGPFFDAHQVGFDDLVMRSRMYVDQEQAAADGGATEEVSVHADRAT